MEDIITRLNALLSNPTTDSIMSLFESESHIRFNNIFISPSLLIDLKSFLDKIGMLSWEIIEDGIILRFPDLFIHFQGFYEIFIKNKLYSFELNFEPITSAEEGRVLMQAIEIFLRKCDAMFFLTFLHNVDAVMLSSPLSASVPFLAKRCQDEFGFGK